MLNYIQPIIIEDSIFSFKHPETEVIFLSDDYSYEAARYYSGNDEFLSEILYKVMYEENSKQGDKRQ